MLLPQIARLAAEGGIFGAIRLPNSDSEAMTNQSTVAVSAGPPGRAQVLLWGVVTGALVSAGATAFVALVFVAIHPFLVTSPILRSELCMTVATAALLGVVGGTLGALLAPRRRWLPSALGLGLLAAMVVAAYSWTGWDGQAHGTVFKTGPLLWSARLPGLAAIIGGGVAGAAVWYWGLARIFARRLGLFRALFGAGLAALLLACLAGAVAGPPSGKGRVVLFGVDGVGLELLERMTQITDLPNFSELLKEHPHGDLLPEPPYSPPSWPTLATGKLPSKHRIDNWGKNDRATGKRKNHVRADIQAATIFDIAEDKGLGGAVFEWPIVGREAKGLDAPLNRMAVFLTGFGSRVPWVLRQAAAMTQKKHERIHLTYKENETGLLTLAHYFWNYTGAKAFGLVVKSTDSSQHHYFHALDPEKWGLDAEEARKTADYIPAIYRIADRMLGGFMASPETNILVFSDHGARPIPTDLPVHFDVAYRFLLNPLLEKWGYLVRREDGSPDLSRSILYNCSDKVLHQQICVNITTERCKAEHSTPEELLARGRPAIESVAARLQTLHFENDGTPLFPPPYTTRWNGRDMTESWLDMGVGEEELVYFPNYDDYDLMIEKGFKIIPFSPELKTRVVVDGDGNRWPLLDLLESREWEGNHRRDGFVAATGPAFSGPLLVQNARTVDIVPTALYLLGPPAAQDMDGQLLRSMLAGGDAIRPLPRIDSYEGQVAHGHGAGTTSYDERLQRDLKALGYID